LIIDGGIVSTPGIDYHFDLGLPPETTFACVAETLILAAEGKYDSCLVGKVQLEKVKEMIKLAKKYNFTHAPFRSFGKLILFKSK
jgi:predicted amino acid dehydrogenase